ncbi:MAG: L-threonylcarbamoyladenylate synthase [Candidatus Saelkia tenebricola]|nr:L-threonylcarbamoyladenylate synthase [Candidatus Saelkia tenebricola]
MRTECLKITPFNPEKGKIDFIIKVFSRGGIVVLPTETVYGVGFDLESDCALKKINNVKNQRDKKPYAVCIPDSSWIKNYDIEEQSLKNFSLIKDFLPGPITFIMTAKDKCKIGFRIPANNITQQVLFAFLKPIGLSSANMSHQTPARGVQEAIDYLWGKVDLIVDGGPSDLCVPSLVVDLSFSPIQILRSGPIFITQEVKKRFKI